MILSIKHLTFSYKKNQVFSNADLLIQKSGIYGLIGPNGSGKTTLLNIIAGLIRPDQGKINFTNRVATKSDLAFVQNSEILYPYLSGYDHLVFICGEHRIPKDKIDVMSQKFSMESYLHRPVKTYSLGMKQRLLLSLALIKDVDLIMLDEPLNGLDPDSTILVRQTLQEMADSGKTVLISSHQLSELDQLTQSFFFIKDQKIIYEELSAKDKQWLILSFQGEYAKEAISLYRSYQIPVEVDGKQLKISLADTSVDELLSLLVNAHIPIQMVQTKAQGSEDYYRQLYERGDSDDQ